ncbi:hypothetical protein BGZ63DRAFT_402426 [Mariannaea sp. PMI_226]|nr:hypothetical protein BGZ63DRAFT_402426 [Mariannaea sp. PMI_226]
MADFLASFNFDAQPALASNDPSCSSIEDLQLHLRRILEAKTTPSRAEHISIALELKASVQFHLSLPRPNNGASAGLNDADPSSISDPTSHGQTERQGLQDVGANEAVMNQPPNDPVLQTSISKHIVTALESVDSSDWTARSICREANGWTFTYLCKSSFQVWNHQNGKSLSKCIIGEYSQREPDPILSDFSCSLARPAFDCRGSIIITFDRNNRVISVKYNHTPIHKTVAELSELFKPPPRQLGPGMQRQLQQKAAQQRTPKKQTDTRVEKRAQDQLGRARRTRKKTFGASPSTAPVAIITVSEDTRTSHDASVMCPNPGLDHSTAAAPSDRRSEQDLGLQRIPESETQRLAGGDASVSTPESRDTQGSQPPPGTNFPVNVTVAEANRRREAAITILNEAGVPPDSLSAEQFSIFSNQAPHLQRESLNMLVKYGAERLRIVHPTTKEGSVSSQTNASPSPSQASQVTSSHPATRELAPQSRSSSDEAAWKPTAAEAQAPSPSRRKMGKSRTACFQCKSHKEKASVCTKERPICSACVTRGETCEYAPQKPRKKPPKKSESIVVESDGPDDNEGDDADTDADAEVDAETDGTEVDASNQYGSIHHDASLYPTYLQMPAGDAHSPKEIHLLPDSLHDSQSLASLAEYNKSTTPQHHASANHGQSYQTMAWEATQQLRQSPTSAVAMSSHARPQNFQATDAPWAQTVQGQRRQEKSPAVDQSTSRGIQPPVASAQHARTGDSAILTLAQASGIPEKRDDRVFNAVTTTKHHKVHLSGYKGFSHAPTIPAVSQPTEPPNQQVSLRTSLPTQAPLSTAMYQTLASDQWIGRAGDEQFSNSTPNYHSNQRTYTPPPSASKDTSPTDKQVYNRRANTLPTRSGQTSFHSQQANHSSYPSQEQQHQHQNQHEHEQQQQQGQMNNQNSNWHNFNNSNINSSFAGTNNTTGYSW